MPRFVYVGSSAIADASAVQSQRITTARRGPCPRRMSRWCRCSRSAVENDWRFSSRRKNEKPVSRIGTARITIGITNGAKKK